MPTVVVLGRNIADENCQLRLRGEQFEASKEFCDSVLEGDAAAGREPRITVIEKKRRRSTKVQNETE